MEQFILISYIICLSILFVFGAHGFVMIYHYYKHRNEVEGDLPLTETPMVTIQLPLYNEMYVVRRLIDASCSIDYPRDRIEIQVVDDSTDETVDLVASIVREKQAKGYDITHVHRTNRQGFKAGALKEGLKTAKGDFIAIFDADFIPKPEFLQKTIPYFFANKNIGMVQTRWEHLNGDYSLMTRTQAMALDGHFVIEQNIRNKAGLDIYLKKFGKAMVTAIESAAFGSAPALEKETGDDLEKQDTSIETKSQGGNITWSDDAELYLQDAPKFIRAKIRSNAEKKAGELGIMEISREFIANLRSGSGT